MFVTHFASGLAIYAKKKGSKLSFFLLVLGTQIADILWGLFTIFGIEGGMTAGNVEHNYFDIPWSHSLIMVIIWSIIYGFVAEFFLNRTTPETTNFTYYAGLSVFSHWIFDFPVHNDDMLLLPIGEIKVPTLFLWDYPVLTFLLEIMLVGLFWFVYWRNLEKPKEFKAIKPIFMLAFMLVLHIIGYIPTFTNSEPMKANVISGFSVILMIIIITAIMTRLHVDNNN